MNRPYVLSHNDKWFVFLGCSLIALCTTKEDALAVQREWIRRGQEWDASEELLPMMTLPAHSAMLIENGVA